jgi:DNA-binding Xre family transcriptional regulator
MQVSYKKLWKLLIDRNITPAELRRQTELSGCTMSKLKKDEPVTVSVLLKVASALNCNIEDICEFYPINEER